MATHDSTMEAVAEHLGLLVTDPVEPQERWELRRDHDSPKKPPLEPNSYSKGHRIDACIRMTDLGVFP